MYMNRCPRKDIHQRTFEFKDLDREILFSNTEYFEVAEDGLFGLGVSINLDA